jgi:hypothetical protein
MKMFLTTDNVLYIYSFGTQEYDAYTYTKYEFVNGQLIRTDSISLGYGEVGDPVFYPVYKHNDQTISESEHTRLTGEILSKAQTMIMEGAGMEESNAARLYANTASLERIAMSYDVALAYLRSGTAQAPATATPTLSASPTASTVLVNGRSVAFDAYNIGGANYFKLRDLAYVLNGTAKQFEVGWNGAANAISLTSGRPYTAVGGEMAGKSGGAKTPTPTSSKLTLNGNTVSFEAYNIGGNNYFKLRDVGAAFDFGVTWDGAKNTVVIDTSTGYTPE